ncbi:hypothetical protein STRDD11_01859 [Streptococcus sp. DD11]|nr:hypothetical protein STRDD11_01859 [Streptococcus sp. DD11]
MVTPKAPSLIAANKRIKAITKVTIILFIAFCLSNSAFVGRRVVRPFLLDFLFAITFIITHLKLECETIYQLKLTENVRENAADSR